MFNDKNNDKNKNSNSTTPIDPAKKDGAFGDPKKDANKVIEPGKENVKVDPKKDETIKH
ncbi:hypothetical protein [Sulfurospirillum diekertiae]|uniref:hypothetical protein n=1 Tax=Sulfurospirillum diekertiae TaxID=1854492 RepID=UPI000DC71C00|nr:hypothetical protein [Sulfurospirillum diekertiae]ASC93351.1 hypothetical protein Sdiek2_1332 [Sulfurospirillum diekertiae]